MKRILTGIALSALIAIPNAQADSSNTQILDFGAFGTYEETNMGQTFDGTGFVGMYEWNAFAHLFGVEAGSFSRTVGQVDIGFLAGQNIISASFEFMLLSGGGANTATFTGFDSGGSIGYTWNAPGTNLGDESFGVSLGFNSVDITDLLQNAVDNDVDWLGFHVSSEPNYLWTYTSFEGDEAAVRLVVEYGDEQPVPEVQHYAAMLGAAMAGVEMMRRRRKA
jgi:hypothetical protein